MSEKRKETFITDDTLHARIRYKRTELCAKANDHSEGRYETPTLHVSVVYVRYIFLAYLCRMETDEKSFGDLFYGIVFELVGIAFDYALALIFSALNDSVRKLFHASGDQIAALMNEIVSRLPELPGNCMR